MHTYRLTHLTDGALLGALPTLVAHDRVAMATLLAHLAEVDARELYLPAGYPSMVVYCVEALDFTESAALKRIRAARTARKFPVLFPALAQGRLHLSGVGLLAGHLQPENVDELVAAAAHRGKSEIERWLRVRFAPPLLVAAASAESMVATRAVEPQLAPGPVARAEVAPRAQLAPGPVVSAPAVVPRTVVRMALPPETEAKLRHARALLSHALPSGELVHVFDRALDALIVTLEKRKFARTSRPRQPRRARPLAKRTIPAHVRRAVWRRDEGQCAFRSKAGQRCSSRTRLEFDHVDPVARGGRPHQDRMRLLCRAHNQFAAEQSYGREFMRRKREQARAGRRGEQSGAAPPG